MTRPTFLWRGILILLPLILLAGIGLYSLRQDRLLAEVEAREQCQNLAENYAALISSRLVPTMTAMTSPPVLSSPLVLDVHGNLVSIDGSAERARLPQNPIPKPLPVEMLSPSQVVAWDEATRTEFAGINAEAAINAWRKFIGHSPRAPFLTQARYNLGLLLAEHKEPAAADELFAKVQSDHEAVTENGLPLSLLAEVQRLPVAASGRSAILRDVYQDAVNHPSFATPAILARLVELDPAPTVANRAWLQKWDRDQAARDFYLHVWQKSDGGTSQMLDFWTTWRGSNWLVVVQPAGSSNVVLRPFDGNLVDLALENILGQAPAQKSYACYNIEIAGEPVLSTHQQWPIPGSILASARAALPPESADKAVSVTESLCHPGSLYAQQRARTVWFTALILVSAMAAVIGFVSAYRGFHQQIRLGEMKSNFVSSVSHELRAPIASMRLLAESLEKGKVASEVKQKEYFGFLVQESRRLSSLIENILDFSRIEQGRRKYQLEPTDLDFLVEQTVKLMQPCAVERGVELKLERANEREREPVQCDGLAVQQALVNLIDNALKHSPGGARVVVGLDRDPSHYRLWVEDNGAGIPAEEHERIFEQFYRRGSELRRETQGIGIGLAIVKHTIEAHQGRIMVRSAPGEGSRFTVELPNQPDSAEEK